MTPAPTPPSGESAPQSLEERIAATELEAFRQQNQTPPEALEARLRETTLEGLLMEFVRQSECVWDTVHDHIQLLKGGEKRLDLEGEAAERLWNVWAGTHPPIVLVEKVARLRAEVARLTSEREEARDDLRRECEASQQIADARRAAEARAARAEDALLEAWWLVQSADPHAWDNGNTGPGGYPDEGAVLASQIMERVAPVADPLLHITPEGADR